MRKYKVLLLSERGSNPPLGLGCLKTYADSDKRLAGKVSVSIEYLENLDAPESVMKLRPDLIGFSSYGSPDGSLERTFRACSRLKALDDKLKIVLGGPGVSLRTTGDIFAAKAVDYFIRGEGEITFAELILHLMSGAPALPEIQGLMFRGMAGPVVTPPRPPIPALNLLRSPYLEGVFNLAGYTEFYVESSRGCPSSCRYCPCSNTKLRYFDAARLLGEVRYIAANAPQARSIAPADADFFLDAPRAKALLRAFKDISLRHGAKFVFTTNPRVWDEEVMSELSCDRFRVCIGIQSTNPRALAYSNRLYGIKKLKRAVRKFQGLAPDARFSMDIISGLPGDDFRGYRKTLDWAISTGANLVPYNLKVFPETHFAKNKERFGIVCEEHYPYALLSNGTFSRKDLLRAGRLLARSGFLFRRLSVDRFVASVILFLGKSLRGKVPQPYLRVCEELSAYMWRKKQFAPLIAEWSTSDQGKYLKDTNLRYRAEMLGLILLFSKKLLEKHGRADRYRPLSRALHAARGRLLFKETVAERAETVKKFINGVPGNTARTLLVCLEDSHLHSHLPGNDVVFIRDAFTDESSRHQEGPVLREPVPAAKIWDFFRSMAQTEAAKFDFIVLSGVYSVFPAGRLAAILKAFCTMSKVNGSLLIFDTLLGSPDPNKAPAGYSDSAAAAALEAAGWGGVRRATNSALPGVAAGKEQQLWFFCGVKNK